MSATKSLLGAALFSFLLVLHAHGQATVNFANRITGTLDAPVFDVDGVTRLAGSAFRARLYAGPTEGSLAAVGSAVPFRTGAGGGYVDTGGESTRTVASVAPGGRVYVQLRAWEAAKGSTYEEAQAAGAKTGVSPIFSVIGGGGLLPPANLIGLTSFRLTLDTKPAIKTQPAPVTVGLGGTARFEVTASGPDPFTYQWRKGTANLPGATSRVLEIKPVTTADAGTYSVRVSNSFGFADSSSALLTIAPVPVIAGVVISPNPPQLGKPLRLEVTAEGTGPFTYQWRLNGSDLPGATSRILDRPAAEAGTFAIRVTGPGGSVSQDVVTVTSEYTLDLVVHPGGKVNASPSQTAYAPGTSVSLSATAESGYVFGGWTGDLAGTANPASVVMNASKRIEAHFRATGGTVFFANRNLGLELDAPVFDVDGTTRLAGDGFVAQLYAGPTAESLGPVGPPSPFRAGEGAGYFYSDTRSIPTVAPGAVAAIQVRAWALSAGATYEAAAASSGPHGASPTITVTTGNVGSPPSLPANLIGLASFRLQNTSAPSILVQPKPVAVGLGGLARFEVTASGSEPLTYQWRKGTSNLPGATSRILEILAVTEADAGSYSIRVSNARGSVDSNPVSLSIVPLPLIAGVLISPNPPSFGKPLRLEVTVEGTGPLTYQWRLNGLDLPGANTRVLERTAAEAGAYSVRVTGPGGTVTREVVTVTSEFVLELVSSPGGKAVATPSQATYASGTVVSLAATADPGFLFTGWSGDLSGTANPASVTMDASKRIEATFRATGGTVYFANRHLAIGLDAPVFDLDGATRLAGDGYAAQLYAGPTAETLAPVGAPVPFRTAEGAGYFQGEIRSIPTVAPGAVAWVQVRTWRVADGATYEAALAANGRRGSSSILSITTGNVGSPPSLPAGLFGLTSFKLQLSAPPVIVTQPRPVTVAIGGVARFEVGATGSDPLTYQWRKGTADLPGANGRILELKPVGSTDAGLYSVRVTNREGSAESEGVALTILPLPVIVGVVVTPTPPVVGERLHLEVHVEGTGPFAYQWLHNGSELAGATSHFLDRPSAQVGTYGVRVTGPGGSVARDVAIVTTDYLLELLPGPGGRIVPTPAQPFYAPGTTVSLAAVPDSGYVFAGWTGDLSGAANPASLVMSAHRRVEAIFRATGGTVYLANRNLGLGIDAPVFAADGTTRLAGTGYVARLYAGLSAESLTPVGPPTPFRAGDGAGYFYSEIRSLPMVAPGAPAWVQVRAWDAASGDTYEAAVASGGAVGSSQILRVTTGNAGTPPGLPTYLVGLASFQLAVGSPPSIVQAPESLERRVGESARFEVLAVGHPPPTYQWRKDGVDLPGATGAVLEIAPVALADAGLYSVQVANTLDAIVSSPAELKVRVPQAISFEPLAPLTFGIPPIPLIATASSGLPVSWTIVSGEGALEGNFLNVGGAGEIRIRASQSGDAVFLAAPPVEQTLVVGKAPAAITFGRLLQSFDGEPRSPEITVVPAGLPVQVTYSGSPTPPSAVGAYAVEATVDTDNYSGRATALFEIRASVQLAGIVFQDRNGDGLRSSDEGGLASVPMQLLALDGVTELRTATTDGSGAFSFSAIAPGNYYLRAHLPTGFTATTPSLRLVNLLAGTVAEESFGAQPVGTVGGVVFADADGDGFRHATEPGLAGVQVRLAGAAGTRDAATDADGTFLFEAVTPGSYTVEETDPEGFTSTTPNLRSVHVAAGGAATAHFGDQAVGMVSGLVFLDANANGSRDSGEPGLGGVTIRLTGSAGTRSQFTDAEGGFRFDSVVPGNYTLEETDPPGFASTTPNLRTLVLTSGGSASASFGDQASATIVGVVFEDINGNGLRDAMEAGIGGVSVHLAGRGVSRSTVTAGDGTYQFSGLDPDSYTIEETDPPGFVSTTPNLRAVSLASGGSSVANFGDQAVQTISGVVFEDQNANGSFDDGEPGIDGVAIVLIRTATEEIVRETTTSGGGWFVFADVPAGDYQVRQALPSAFTVASIPGLPPTPSRHGLPAPTSFVSKPVSLAAGGAAAVNFANQVIGQLIGKVFNDLDGNGTQSVEEPGIGSVTVEVRDAETGQIVATAVTSGSGIYLVSRLSPGLYDVVQRPIAGYFTTQPSVNLALAGGGGLSANFANRAAGTVSGRVFNDEDGDGLADPAEPGMGGVLVTLRGATLQTRQTVTSGDGSFLFDAIAPGTLAVEAALPAGFRGTTPTNATLILESGAATSTRFGFQGEAAQPPSVTTEPQDLTLAEGASGALSAQAAGTAPLEFQWLKNGTPIPGATNLALAFASAGSTDTAGYQLRVRNPVATVLSRTARVTVTITTTDPFAAWVATQDLPVASRRPTDDPDGDQLANLLEFVLGTSPNSLTTTNLPEGVVVSRDGSTYLGFELNRTRAAEGIRLFLEASEDLVHWSAIESRLEVVGTSVDSDLVRVIDPTPTSSRPLRFLRLGVAPSTTRITPARLVLVSGPPIALTFRMTLEGQPGQVYRLERSSDLRAWTAFQDVTAGTSPVTITDNDVSGVEFQFYRAVAR